MLGAFIKPYITPSLDKIAAKVEEHRIPANIVTLTGFAIGLIGCFFIGIQSYLFGLLFLIANRLFDGLDGALARRQGASAFGGYLDTLCDHAVYAAFVFFFVMSLPMHLLGGAFLLFSYVALTASSLAYAIMALRHDGAFDAQDEPLVGGAEITVFMAVVCLFPHLFSAIAFLFGVACWVSSFQRTFKAWSVYGPTLETPPIEQPDTAPSDEPDEQGESGEQTPN